MGDGGAARAVCLCAKRHARRAGHELSAVRSLFLPNVCRSAVSPDYFCCLAARHSLGTTTVWHDGRSGRPVVGSAPRRRRPACDPAGSMSDLREPCLVQPIHPLHDGGGRASRLHSHREGKGSRAVASALSPRLSQHAHSACHAAGPVAAKFAGRFCDY